MGKSVAVTDGIRVEVHSFHIPERSLPERGQFFFGYKITISNEGDTAARLVSRHWVITDGNGQVEQVKGPGVVGETPHLDPGESFEYQSFCPLPTPIGAMRGSYAMVRDDGARFEAAIAEFSLEVPDALN